jgi:TolB-like protein/Tfp pilus assembly protein PilF
VAGADAGTIMVPLTTFTGAKDFAAFSPDGRDIAFSWMGPEQGASLRHIYRKPLAAADPVQLTSGAGDDTWPAWSPDGREIAYVLATAFALWPAPRPRAPTHIQSVAVLPLVNQSGDPAQDDLVDGLTDQLIAEIAHATSLRVISRTSVMPYKGVAQHLPEIASALNVDGVVEGSVQWAGDRVSVSAQLLDARRERQLWARTYDAGTAELNTLVGEITADVAHQLTGASPPDRRSVSPRPVDSRAYELYMRGRVAWNQRTPDGYREALGYFNGAIAHDPAYAPAYAGLADTYLLLGEYLIQPSADAFARARAAASRAIALDERLHPYAALGQINANEWRWAEADREFLRALARDPNYATGRQWRAEFLAVSGRTDDAVAEIQQAKALDPLSPIINAQLGWILMIARRYEDAIAQLRRTIDMAPGLIQAHTNLGIALSLHGDHESALAAFEQAVAANGGVDASLWLAREYALGGRPDRTRVMMEDVKPAVTQGSASPSTLALVYLALGDTNSAVSWLKTA